MAMHRGMLDAALLQLTPQTRWNVRTALTHTLVLGTTGSGKTSGTMAHAIRAMLRAGFGALFCTAKSEDVEAYLAWCHEAGRSDSVINWWPGNGGFNFLAHELARGGSIANTLDVLMAVLEMIRSSSPSPGKASEQFWTDSVKQMLMAVIPVLLAATGTVRIADILAFIRSAPTSHEQMRDPAWQREAPFFQFVLVAMERAGSVPGFDEAAAERALNYWRDDYARLDQKTASNIRISLTTALSRFEHGWLADMFCGETTIVPELLLSGAVIVMNFPVQTHGEDAAIAQKLFKFMAQRVLLARNGMAPHLREIPVAIVADEAQNFLLPNDAEFMAQCRSSRVAVLMATQSLPTLYAKVSGDHPHDRTHHLVSNFATIVVHSSGCAETNEWMAKKIGKTIQRRGTFSESEGSNRSFGMNMGEGTNYSHQVRPNRFGSPLGGFAVDEPIWSPNGSQGGGDNWGRNQSTGSNHGTSHGWSEQVDWLVPPEFFSRALKSGGPANGNRVSAVWWQAGGQPLLVEFQQ